MFEHFFSMICRENYIYIFVLVCSSLCMSAFIYSELHTHAQQVRICCHNTDLVHVNGHDRIILVIFSQALYKSR